MCPHVSPRSCFLKNGNGILDRGEPDISVERVNFMDCQKLAAPSRSWGTFQAQLSLMWRREGEGFEGGHRDLGPPREIIGDLFDHRRIFVARDHLDLDTTVLAAQGDDLEYTRQTLRPRHRDVAGWRGIPSNLGLAPASSGRRHLFTQSMVQRGHPVVARKLNPWHRHQRGQPDHEVQWLEHHVRRTIPVGRLQRITNIPLRG